MADYGVRFQQEDQLVVPDFDPALPSVFGLK